MYTIADFIGAAADRLEESKALGVIMGALEITDKNYLLTLVNNMAERSLNYHSLWVSESKRRGPWGRTYAARSPISDILSGRLSELAFSMADTEKDGLLLERVACCWEKAGDSATYRNFLKAASICYQKGRDVRERLGESDLAAILERKQMNTGYFEIKDIDFLDLDLPRKLNRIISDCYATKGAGTSILARYKSLTDEDLDRMVDGNKVAG